jgi:hypothetical protein
MEPRLLCRRLPSPEKESVQPVFRGSHFARQSALKRQGSMSFPGRRAPKRFFVQRACFRLLQTSKGGLRARLSESWGLMLHDGRARTRKRFPVDDPATGLKPAATAACAAGDRDGDANVLTRLLGCFQSLNITPRTISVAFSNQALMHFSVDIFGLPRRSASARPSSTRAGIVWCNWPCDP